MKEKMLREYKKEKTNVCSFCEGAVNCVGVHKNEAIYSCSSCANVFGTPFLPKQITDILKESVIHLAPRNGSEYIKARQVREDFFNGVEFRVMNGKSLVKRLSVYNAPSPSVLIFHYYDKKRTCKIRIDENHEYYPNVSSRRK
jgi:hypothetical protein